MSNPTSVITERRLGEFYQEILPYLGGKADAGFTPIGSIIPLMGVTAPANYLACNGQIVNVADYPELATYFEQQFGTKYKFGGSGTTFGIPDLRGEFLRGTGTNGHTGQGDGASVGVHQDSTQLPNVFVLSSKLTQVGGVSDATTAATVKNPDGSKTASIRYNEITASNSQVNASGTLQNIRPTNTSVLYCIATKDIYLNPSNDYSTSEKVIGKWIDGKTLYQKTFANLAFPQLATGDKTGIVNYNLLSGIDAVCDYSINVANSSNTGRYKNNHIAYDRTNDVTTMVFNCWVSNLSGDVKLNIRSNDVDYNISTATVTIQYTKTT